jgi:hypothetical protein
MTLPGLGRTPLDAAMGALERDLLHDDGPRISTMRNYRFAIVPYDPRQEFELRHHVQSLTARLRAGGWVVLSISLYELLVQRVRGLGDDVVRRIADWERRAAAVAPERGLEFLKTKLQPLIEGEDGVAGDCARTIGAFADAHPDQVDRALVLVGRAGALYPHFRMSALLRYLDGRTRNVPVVLLYPGERRGAEGLSFMGMLNADRDYRPRIYP